MLVSFFISRKRGSQNWSALQIRGNFDWKYQQVEENITLADFLKVYSTQLSNIKIAAIKYNLKMFHLSNKITITRVLIFQHACTVHSFVNVF